MAASAEPQQTYAALAELYDAAFAWDVAAEVDWLIARLGGDVRRIVEPACGSGRMFPAFAARGVSVAGVDCSPVMLARARQRMRDAGLPSPTVVQADMAAFSLAERFDGAICPINSFGYLLDEDAALQHLRCVADHLRGGAKYLVQVDLMDTDVSVEYGRDDCMQWVAAHAGRRVRCTWQAVRFDAATRLQTERAVFEVLEGADAGRVYEDEHVQRRWGWDEWRQLIADSPFEQVAVYDGGRSGVWPPLALEASVEQAALTWHELVLPESWVAGR